MQHCQQCLISMMKMLGNYFYYCQSLRYPRRGGRGRYSKDIGDRMERWQKGDLENLYREAKGETNNVRRGNRFMRAKKMCSVLTRLCRMLNLIVNGNICTGVRSIVGGGALCALKKRAGGIRPICMGLVLRRLVSKIVCRLLKQKFVETLSPSQVGVGVPSGAELIFHEIDKCCRKDRQNEDKVLLQVDFENAFDNCDRQVFLDEVKTLFPELYQYVRCLYGVVGCLWFGSKMVRSRRGTQQGDPLGPVLFSLVVRKLILLLKRRPALMLISGFWMTATCMAILTKSEGMEADIEERPELG